MNTGNRPIKNYITLEDLSELNEFQRNRLRSLWIPKKYDLAAGFLCKDAESNEYDIFEFVVGHVNIAETRSGYSMTLVNIEAIRGLSVKEGEGQEAADEETEYCEEDFIFEYERPDIYCKEDCLPLFNIGQMLEILNKCGYGNGDFYVSFMRNTKECEIGRDIEQYIDYGPDYIGEELCDVLWTAVKEIL